MLAKTHSRQIDRLAALHRYEILDTDDEKDFDEIVEIAADICEKPMALISLVDSDRQWFKAKIGLSPCETPLEQSICSHAILEDRILEIRDTLKDPRTRNNTLCTAEPQLRFYAGVPLMTDDGLPIGTLCVLDTKPGALTHLQKRTLAVLARQIMRELDLKVALKEQEVLRNEMDHRVKNSLQTVSSLIRLYKNKAPEESREAFDAIARRIEAISLLHKELHQASEAETVRLDRYIPRVIDLLQDVAPSNVSLSCDVERIRVGSAAASALGVIISEFAANSIKHAFPGGRRGNVTTSVKRGPDGAIYVTCCDDGIGASQAPSEPSAVEGLGLRLVAASAAQIGAEIIREPTPDGYTLRFSFTYPKQAAPMINRPAEAFHIS